MHTALESVYKLLSSNNIFGLEAIHLLIKLQHKKNHTYDNSMCEDITKLISEYKITTYDIFSYFLDHDNLNIIKEYSKFYNNKLLVQYVQNMVNVNENVKTILDANMKINSFLENINNKQLYGIQTNDIIYDIHTINNNNNVILKNDNIICNDMPFEQKHFDVIFCDFPTDIHNMIYASCCNKIKKLKIRGTKSEPLLLHLIMMSLNKNGKACLIVPDALLFSDSNQFVKTRKYLLENFNIKQIVEIKGTKSSILYFENNGNTKTIECMKLNIINNIITSTNVININMNIIKDNNYSLWYKQYIDTPKSNQLEYTDVESLFHVYSDNFPINTNGLALNKYYENSSSIKIGNIKDNNKCFYFIVLKNDTSNLFLLYYLESIINSSYEQFTKGKMKVFDMSKIKKYMLPIISTDKQLAMNNYIKISNDIIDKNNKQIEQYNLLKTSLFESLFLKEYVTLGDITSLYNDNIIKDKMIGIIRNGLNAGSVYIVNKNDTIQNNSYYLQSSSNASLEYNIDFIYHWMKYMENKLILLSNLTSQPNLNKSNLLQFNVPKLDISNMNTIVSYCNEFDMNINKYLLSNQTIKEKNIFNTVLKLYNL